MTRYEGYHAHDFYVPGMHFAMLVGGKLPKEMSLLYKERQDEVPLWFSKTRESGFFGWFVKDLRKNQQVYQQLIAKMRGRAV